MIVVVRMVVICGVGFNNVLVIGVNMLGDVYGGVGE